MFDNYDKTFKDKIVLNGRILSGTLTGSQRYTIELLHELDCYIDVIAPKKFLNGLKGHIWEQAILPHKIDNKLLWSPSITGPLSVQNQVVTIHDTVPLDHPEWLNPQFARWYRFLVPRLARRVKHIISISEFTKNQILKWTGIDESKITVIPNGVSSSFFPQKPVQINNVLQTLNIPSKRYILSLSSLEPRKNLKRLLKAWSIVHKKLPDDVWLVIAGAKGSSLIYKELNLRNDLPRVFFTGHVKDEYLPQLISGALFFVYLSVYEGFGLPPLEAMASGTPVLTGDLTAIPEVVCDAGIKVNPFDVDQICYNIISLVDNDRTRKELSKKGIEQAKMFSWKKTADLTLQTMIKLL